MSHEEISLSATPEATNPSAQKHVLHEVLRFLRVVRFRLPILVFSLIAACLLGGFYYATATRMYRAGATVWIAQKGIDMNNASPLSADIAMQGLMPTYEQIFTSAVVLQEAVVQLSRKEPEALVDFQGVPRDQWIKVIKENLVARTQRRTNLIEVEFLSKSPQGAVEVVNAVVEAYRQFIDKNHKNVALEVATLLEKERDNVEHRLHDKQSELLAAKIECGNIGIDENNQELHPDVSNVVQLNEALMQVRQNRIELEALLEAANKAVTTGDDLRQFLVKVDPEFGRELLRSSFGISSHDLAAVSKLEQELLDNQMKLRRLEEHYGPAHFEVVAVKESIRAIQRYLQDFQAGVQNRMQTLDDDALAGLVTGMVRQQLAQAWQHEQKLQQQFDEAYEKALALNGALAKVSVLEHDMSMLRRLHDALVDRIDNIDISDNHTDILVGVVNYPQLPRTASSPRTLYVVAMVLLFGLGSGCGVVYVLDILDDRFRSPEELQMQLGIPVLTMVRRFEQDEMPGIQGLPVVQAPESVECESFRTLRTALAFQNTDTMRLAITSAEPGDGKTTILANLAASFALAGKKTLIIDADMRRPGLSRQFQLRKERGLSEILRSSEPLGELCLDRIFQTGLENLDILPCGPRPADPSELLGRNRMSDLIAWAETVYDQILIDCPPALAAADVVVVGRIIDGVLLVVNPDKNNRRGVLRTVQMLSSLGVRMLGTVVNRVANEKQHGYYGHDSAYGYQYGYGYNYAYSSNDSDDPDDLDVDAPQDESPAPIAPPSRKDDSDDGIVPRRVA